MYCSCQLSLNACSSGIGSVSLEYAGVRTVSALKLVHSRKKTKADARFTQLKWLENEVNEAEAVDSVVLEEPEAAEAVVTGGTIDGFSLEDFYPYTEFDTIQAILAGGTLVFRFGEKGLGFYNDAGMYKKAKEALRAIKGPDNVIGLRDRENDVQFEKTRLFQSTSTVHRSHRLPLFIPFSLVSKKEETLETWDLYGYERLNIDIRLNDMWKHYPEFIKIFGAEDLMKKLNFFDPNKVVISFQGWILKSSKIESAINKISGGLTSGGLFLVWLKQVVHNNKTLIQENKNYLLDEISRYNNREATGAIETLDLQDFKFVDIKTAIQKMTYDNVNAHVVKQIQELSIFKTEGI
jgi:hypothetical protein